MGSHRRSIRRSIVIRASVFLLLIGGAAIVNVAVAWGACIAFANPDPFSGERADIKGLDTMLSARGLSLDYIEYTGGAAFVCRRPGVMFQTLIYGSGIGHQDCEIRAGFPMRCAWGLTSSVMPDSGRSRQAMMEISLPNGEVRNLPVRPIWPGFAINTLFYAAFLWGLFAAPLALRGVRRRRRIKRGLCPKCAYPIGESDVCTECGTPVTRQVRSVSM